MTASTTKTKPLTDQQRDILLTALYDRAQQAEAYSARFERDMEAYRMLTRTYNKGGRQTKSPGYLVSVKRLIRQHNEIARIAMEMHAALERDQDAFMVTF